MNECDEPICESKFDMFRQSLNHSKSNKNILENKNNIKNVMKNDGPLDKDELGNKTWSILHTIAAYYPKNPTKEYQEQVKTFMTALSILYPCSYCAKDFQKELIKSPPNVMNRESFSLWLCEQHNIVNEKINKEKFTCTMELLDKRWRRRKNNE